MGSTGRVALDCNFGGFVSFLAGLFGFILAGTDIRYVVDDGQFWSQKFNSEILDGWTILCLRQTHRQTDRHTDTLLIFIQYVCGQYAMRNLGANSA